jgi:hypothetical protein
MDENFVLYSSVSEKMKAKQSSGEQTCAFQDTDVEKTDNVSPMRLIDGHIQQSPKPLVLRVTKHPPCKHQGDGLPKTMHALQATKIMHRELIIDGSLFIVM